MSWQDRLKDAAYTSPSGIRIKFSYEDVSKAIEKRTSAFEFPDVDGTYIQDLGRSGRRYPLRIFFHGDDCDIEAQAFEDILIERGQGTLEHPLYGAKEVVPFGEITRRDDLATGANQAVMEVVFWETIGIIYPSSQEDAAKKTSLSIDNYNQQSASQFMEYVDIDTIADQVTLKNTYSAILGQATTALNNVASSTEKVKKQFDTINDSINNGIDTLIGDPLTLAFQTSILIQAPARAVTLIGQRLTAYRDLGQRIISGDGASERSNNDFHSSDLYASGYVTGSITSILNTDFETRPQAISAAEEILEQFENLSAWRDLNFEYLEQIDTGASYQALLDAVSLAAGYLVAASFGLKQERRVVLSRAKTMIQLCSEFYKSVDDDTLNFFINSNSLVGSEIYEEIPAGREILYYV